jgi:hypothetical protein
MGSEYAAIHESPNGRGNALLTVLQMIKDENFEGNGTIEPFSILDAPRGWTFYRLKLSSKQALHSC